MFNVLSGDGTVSFEEFLELKEKYYDPNHESALLEAFKVIDKSGDGYLNAEELRHYMENIGEKLTEDEVNEMIREADINGDGKIDYTGKS